MTTIRAAVFRTPGLPLRIEEVEMDRPRATEVVVRTVASGVCHSDLHYVEGENSLGIQLGAGGTVLGHEGAGFVEAVGDGVTYVQPGDHVVGCLSKFCGVCDQCLSGSPARCRVSYRIIREQRLSQAGVSVTPFAGLGAYATKMLTEQNNLVKVPDDIPFASAALLGCGVTTGLGAVFHSAKVPPGATVAVIGCGGVGLSILQGARLAGASAIIAIDTAEAKREMALGAGATHFVNATEANVVEAVREITGSGVDFSFEAVGHPALVRQALECLDVGGLCVVVGVQPAGTVYNIPSDAFYGEKRLQSCTMGSNRFRIDIPRWVNLYRQGRLDLDSMVTNRRPLDELNEAFADMKTGAVARTVLVFDE